MKAKDYSRMEFIKYRYSNNRYRYEDSNSRAMCYIGGFLVEDASPFWVTFALDEESGCCCTNSSRLCRDDDYIEISCSYEKDEDFDDDTIVRCGRILIPEFIKLVEKWDNLMRDVPPRNVLLTCDNERYTLETSEDIFSYVKLVFNPHKNCYEIFMPSDNEIHMIALALIDCIQFDTKSCKNFLNNNNDSIKEQNSKKLIVTKRYNYIRLEPVFQEREYPYLYPTILAKKLFMDLLDLWQTQVCYTRPKTVILTFDGYTFTLRTHMT